MVKLKWEIKRQAFLQEFTGVLGFQYKATVEDEKFSNKINDEGKQKILDKCNEIISQLD